MEAGCRQNKEDVWWWLFDCLEEGVEGLSREHMDFIEDKDLEPIACWSDSNAVDDDITNVVDTRVRGRIDLLHIDRIAGGDFETRVAAQTRLAGHALRTIQALREDSRRGCLAGTPDTGKYVGVMNAVLIKRVLEGPGDVFLSSKVGECLWPVFARNYLIAQFSTPERAYGESLFLTISQHNPGAGSAQGIG